MEAEFCVKLAGGLRLEAGGGVWGETYGQLVSRKLEAEFRLMLISTR